MDEMQLQGVSNDLFVWAVDSPLIKKVFADLDDSQLRDQLNAFFSDNEEKRSVVAIELYKLLWGHYRSFGPLPPIELLQKSEYDRVYYSEYRDHTTHSLRICLIGLCIFENNRFVRDTFFEYINRYKLASDTQSLEDIFSSTWILASLYHDLGYLFENTKIDSDEKYKELVLATINSILSTPLAHTPYFSSRLSEEKESSIINDNEVFTWKLSSVPSLDNKEAFGLLAEASSNSKLASSGINGVKQYYELAQKTKPEKRPAPYRDHGIASALLLLSTCE